MRVFALLILTMATACDSALDVKVSGAAATNIVGAEDCFDPDLHRIATDVSVSLCDGSRANGLMDLSNLMPENIVEGKIIANVVGAAKIR